MFLLTGSPDQAIAIYEGANGGIVSYGQLREQVARRAVEISAAAGAGKKLVLLLARNDLASVETYLAALGLGHAVALFNSTLAPDLLVELLDRYQPEIVHAECDSVPRYERTGAASVWRRLMPSTGTLAPELALLLSTSGSTGSPKLVRLTARPWRSPHRTAPLPACP
jgi:acyl-coenzyme A synthetase/AMP-(fatty) acid ligase